MAEERDEAAERLRQLQEGIRNGTIRIELPATATPENMPRPEPHTGPFDVTAIQVETFAHPEARGVVIRYGIRAFGFGEVAIAMKRNGGALFVDTEGLTVDGLIAILQAAAPTLATLFRRPEVTAAIIQEGAPVFARLLQCVEEAAQAGAPEEGGEA
jgi:hypothetical protein